MNHPAEPEEDLLCLLRGELGREQTRQTAEHLRVCESCRLALVDVAEIHGTLVAAGRLLGRITVESPAMLSAAIPSAAPGGRAGPGDWEGPAGWPGSGDLVEPAEALPPLRVPHRRRTFPRLAAGIAAGVLVVAGLGVGSLVLTSRDKPPVAAVRIPPPVAAGRSIILEPVTGAAAGRVSMQTPGTQTEMTISTKGLPDAGSGRFYYAWLLDPQTQKMLPLGVVSSRNAMHFEVPTGLVKRYHAVDISLQADNGNPGHSATSVLRALY